jgi:hypothetical protein
MIWYKINSVIGLILSCSGENRLMGPSGRFEWIIME